MDKLKFTCNEINEASKKDTVKTLLPYKTPILYGALNIINEFKKNDDDGIDYKNLCNKLSKYAMSQKNCVRDVVTSKQKKFERGEWKNIIKDLVHTYERQDVKRLCYYEDDKDVSKKKITKNFNITLGYLLISLNTFYDFTFLFFITTISYFSKCFHIIISLLN
ncbi:hypothetical protein POVWA2_071180 [Plasmodium ovale wallikeri]|uniref:Uncharacterized protein n=1 Tax=Plasmodium ovale wallikeri TaxID=864142 RepID=A0A1A9AIP0_PLAOA|nr:hypothetical protein POVWA2_071180 [Plasmodium ovale wallikeri]